MADEFNLAQGIEIDNLTDIHECYEVKENNIFANICFEKLSNLVTDSCKELKEPLFFFLEIPCDEITENELRKNDDDPFHKNVYYLDNCNFKVILAIIKRYGDLLLNDGLVEFGFASHTDEDEIYIKKYKLLSIYSKNINKYIKVLEKYKIPFEDNIKTIWDILSDSNVGTCTSIEFNGENIYDIVENLTETGLYFSHRIED